LAFYVYYRGVGELTDFEYYLLLSVLLVVGLSGFYIIIKACVFALKVISKFSARVYFDIWKEIFEDLKRRRKQD